MARLGDMLPGGIIGIGKPFVKVNEVDIGREGDIKQEELSQIASQIWEELSVKHNRWSGIEKLIRNGNYSPVMTYNVSAGRPENTPLTEDELASVKAMVKYHFEQTQMAMSGLD